MNQEKTPLFDALLTHIKKRPISLHVPGHKNGQVFPEKGLPYFQDLLALDVTELTGLDDLHEPEEAIFEAEALLASLYGAEKSFFLVNGSTVGNLAMVLSVCSRDEKVLVQRNCHKSVMNALMMAGAKPVFLTPEFDKDVQVPSYIHIQTVKKALLEHPDAKAIVLTNPNYYGQTYDLKNIIESAHQMNVPVLVDEAHGAHFGIGKTFPTSALQCGADIVVQSAHKTLPAMTMGSYLHYQSKLVPLEKVSFYLKALQSSSPSYPIMASLDLARYHLYHFKQADDHEFYKSIYQLREEIDKIPSIQCVRSKDDHVAQDPLKIIIQSRSQVSGFDIKARLESVGLFVELADPHNVLLILPLGVINHDQILSKMQQALQQVEIKGTKPNEKSIYANLESKVPYSYYELQFKKSVKVQIEDSVDKISAQTIIPYPPGIPLLLQGEVITDKHLQELAMLKRVGAKIQGSIEGEINIYES
ncbi:aminotransferase class I/II-fold pyridoxal phosphate-dependent enzyme [Bacillus pinisoli]|uniref:aminotransferase class I/II-fold pyridoxal phosphate-dependent enzyme n=1 Tax=Bacillus pinisoli TaxID=2901866 RepID=UPI001FF5D68B|nr:aminotransferase class V-fold PLP-dependent enzyme [Bacillus pinisoli]